MKTHADAQIEVSSADATGATIVVGAVLKTRVANSAVSGVTVIDSQSTALFIPASPIPSVSEAEESDGEKTVSRAELERIYPQWQEGEEGGEVGEATRLLAAARTDLIAASLALPDDMPTVLNHLMVAENALFRAVQAFRTNEAWASMVSFCAWGLRNARAGEVTRAMLDRMIAALGQVESRPFLSITRLGSIVQALEEVDWDGDSPITAAFKEGLSEQMEPE